MLKESLSQAGIRVDSFNVSSGADFSQFAGHGNSAWQQPKGSAHTGGGDVETDPASVPISAVMSGSGPQAAASYSWLA
jgi:hypothetical protein